MAVIVHHQRVADLLGVEIGSLDPERPDAAAHIEDPVGMGANGRKLGRNILDCEAADPCAAVALWHRRRGR